MDALRIISLGGFADVTQNMFAYHYLPEGKEKNDQILIIDCGVGFPEEGAYGVDLVIPDASYVNERKEKIVGIILTHAHEDHIGALPFIMPNLGANVPIFAPPLAAAFAAERMLETGLTYPIKTFQSGANIRLGKFLVEVARVNHSVPDTFHLFIQTPVGNFYHGADFKFDLTPPDGIASEFTKMSEFAKKGVLCLLSDSLGADKSGFSPSEVELNQTFEDQIRQAKGRVFLTAISSNIYRWNAAIDASRKFSRKICLLGFSIEKSVRIASKLNYLRIKPDNLVDLRKAQNLPDNKIAYLVAGSLAQSGSTLEKIVLGKHKLTPKKGDKFIFSSPDYVPGTSKAIHRLIDTLLQQGADVVYDSSEGLLHVSGHGYREELMLLISLLSPKNLLPIGSEWRQMAFYYATAKKMGYKTENLVVPKNNAMPTFWQNGKFDLNFKLPVRKVLVDGLGVGDVGQTVLRDRRILAKEGMIVIILLIDGASKNLTEPPSVISRGFVYVKESQKILDEIKKQTELCFAETKGPIFNLDNIRFQIQNRLEELVFRQTGRRPMVMPVMMEI